ncbi:MAG: AsnC family transcriptional regulator [Candidatus Thorarchaeota archaeon]|nr:AsnC family transcriptional regulator [Candidatus Thorarchaeota archaeon]
MQVILSDAERGLLEALVQNSRYTPAIIGQLIGKSRNWVSRTIKGLVKSGAIRSYTTIIDPAHVQGTRETILFMKSNPREQDVSSKLMDMEELESLDGIAGDFSLLGTFRFDSQGAFENLLDRVDSVVASSGAGKYNIVQVLTTYKKNRFTIIPSSSPESYLSRKELALLRVMYRHEPTVENPFPLTQEEIGTRMNPPLSQPAVSKSIEKLMIKRAIIGYSISTDFSLIGLPVKFFVRIKVSPGTASDIAQKLTSMREVWDLYRTSEDYSLLAMVRISSVMAFNQFLRRLYESKDVLDTESYISLEEWFLPIR